MKLPRLWTTSFKRLRWYELCIVFLDIPLALVLILVLIFMERRKMSQSSLESFRAVQDGVASQREVLYKMLCAFGPCTTYELMQNIHFHIMQPRARMHELFKAKRIFPVGKRLCKVTGYMNTVWGVHNG